MARRRTSSRRRSFKTVLSNPGRRRKAPRVARNPSRRRKSRKASRRRSRKSSGRSRSRARRRNPSRRSKMRSRRRSGSRFKRRNPSRKAYRRATHKARAKLYRRSKRRNPAYKLSSRSKTGWKRIRNGRKRFSRRNGYGKMFKRIPLVGGILGTSIGTIPTGIAAGVATEIPLRLSPWVMSQTWIPQIFKENEWVYFTTLGALSGAAVTAALKMAGVKTLPLVGSVGNLPGLMTAAASGAGYIQMRTRQLANEAGVTTPAQQVAGDEPMAGLGAIVSQGSGVYGALTTNMGMGPAYDVAPGGYGYGALVAAGAL